QSNGWDRLPDVRQSNDQWRNRAREWTCEDDSERHGNDYDECCCHQRKLEMFHQARFKVGCVQRALLNGIELETAYPAKQCNPYDDQQQWEAEGSNQLISSERIQCSSLLSSDAQRVAPQCLHQHGRRLEDAA